MIRCCFCSQSTSKFKFLTFLDVLNVKYSNIAPRLGNTHYSIALFLHILYFFYFIILKQPIRNSIFPIFYLIKLANNRN